MPQPGGPAVSHRNTAIRRLAAALTLTLVGAGCTLPPLSTPTVRPTPTPPPSVTATPSPTPAPPTPTPEPTPDLAAIPAFAAGEIVASRIDGLRVRQRPGIDAPIATGLLPFESQLRVVMGPFLLDDFGWYLVTDADTAEPAFEEGWVAAGYEPDALLRSTGSVDADAGFLVSLAGSGNAENGPITIRRRLDHAVRWIARDPEGIGCTFAVSLRDASGDPIPAIRATVGSGVDRGILQPQTFASLRVRGTVFVVVASDCHWSLVLQRMPEAAPTPSPTETP